MHTPRTTVATHTPEFDVNNAAGVQPDRGFCVSGVVNTFVEADGRAQLGLQYCMLVNVIPCQWLFDHHEVEGVKSEESVAVGQAVCRVGVHHEPDFRILPANCLDQVKIVPGLDFDLDALVSIE